VIAVAKAVVEEREGVAPEHRCERARQEAEVGRLMPQRDPVLVELIPFARLLRLARCDLSSDSYGDRCLLGRRGCERRFGCGCGEGGTQLDSVFV